MVARTFDRLPEFDPRSRLFPVAAGIEDKPLRSYTWGNPMGRYLDQGSEGACVGFSWAHELLVRPSVIRTVTEDDARRIYHYAQTVDEWPGENYDGTSVLAGAKAVQMMRYLGEYRWAFSEHDLALAIGYKGPAVLGVWWYEGMLDADADGYVHADGEKVGGHAILCDSFNIKKNRYRLTNSWGSGWGYHGCCFVTREDMRKLLYDQGEACIPVQRLPGV